MRRAPKRPSDGAPSDQRFAHGLIIALCLMVLTASAVLQVQPDGESLRDPQTAIVLHPHCLVRTYLHHDCPLCGLSRAFVLIAHGRLDAAWQQNPAGLAAFLFVLMQLPYRVVLLGRTRETTDRGRAAPGLLLAAALLLIWIGRLTV